MKGHLSNPPAGVVRCLSPTHRTPADVSADHSTVETCPCHEQLPMSRARIPDKGWPRGVCGRASHSKVGGCRRPPCPDRLKRGGPSSRAPLVQATNGTILGLPGTSCSKARLVYRGRCRRESFQTTLACVGRASRVICVREREGNGRSFHRLVGEGDQTRGPRCYS